MNGYDKILFENPDSLEDIRDCLPAIQGFKREDVKRGRRYGRVYIYQSLERSGEVLIWHDNNKVVVKFGDKIDE